MNKFTHLIRLRSPLSMESVVYFCTSEWSFPLCGYLYTPWMEAFVNARRWVEAHKGE
ncbi:MAG: hypothetical protein IIV54_00815 [Bacteroidaceae bacterium]|nr:hypothetical protein [Bacteroidaceae bacterium]